MTEYRPMMMPIPSIAAFEEALCTRLIIYTDLGRTIRAAERERAFMFKGVLVFWCFGVFR